MKVLLVDDDPIIIMTIESHLKKWGYDPVIANSAEQAWEIMQQPDAPLMVIIDWVMPAGMNGIELCKLIKNRSTLSFCYVVMLTGRICTDDVVIGLESGADDYVIKPIDINELRARILAGKRILDKFETLKRTPVSGEQNKSIKIKKSLNFSAPKILIAEDDPVSREVLKENLAQWGFNAIVTTNGKEALDTYKEHNGQLLAIVDWMMPELSGVDVCREIKKNSEDGTNYIILLTAKTQRIDVAEGLEAGADDYLCKPFHAAELRARINVGIRTLSTNRHLKAVVANNSEGIVTIGGDGIIDTFNPAAERMFGCQTYEILGENFSSLIANSDKDKYSDYLKVIIGGENTSAQELTGLKQGQLEFPLELSLARMGYDGNQRLVGIIRDITEHKYTQQALILAKESAEEANQAKSKFLSSMSHELRTPLNAILGFAQLLESDLENPLAEDQKESLDYILQGGHHLLGLINEVLDLAKIESGYVSIDAVNLNVDEVIKSSVAMVRQLAKKSVVEIFQSETTVITQVKADNDRLRQVIINLLSNAIKYNSRPGAIFIEKSQPQKGVIRISVRDTGIGIAKGQQEHLFKPFSRLGAEISEIEGSGIGLVITKTLIETMEGRVGFESTEGEGSTFWVDLPVYN